MFVRGIVRQKSFSYYCCVLTEQDVDEGLIVDDYHLTTRPSNGYPVRHLHGISSRLTCWCSFPWQRFTAHHVCKAIWPRIAPFTNFHLSLLGLNPSRRVPAGERLL